MVVYIFTRINGIKNYKCSWINKKQNKDNNKNANKNKKNHIK